jgi:hypothetical protein
MWATETVIANGQTVDGVELRLQPYLSVSGRAGFEGARSRPDVRSAQITLIPVQLPEQRWIPSATAHPDSDGHFGFDVIPGNYRLAASFPGTAGSVSPWWLMEATIDKHDALREAVDVRDSLPARVTFTDRVAHLTGTVLSSAGAPTSDYSVLIFSTDRTSWMPQARAVRLTRPGIDGKYSFTNLAPGEYLLAAVDDLEPAEMFDAALLEQLARSAVRITLVEGDKKVQDLPGGCYH